MPRRAKPKTKKRDWRWYASFGLNGLVALSMVLGTVFIFTGGSSLLQRAAPTLEIPVDIPTLAPTVSSDSSAALTPLATLPPSTPAATPTPTPR